MDAEKFGKDYIRALKSALPDREFPRFDPAWLVYWEETLMSHGWILLQKDESFFNEPRECIPGVNFSEFWKDLKEDDKTTIWRFLQMSLVVSFMDGDPMAKVEKLIGNIKSWWSSSGRESSEIDELLDDEKTPGHLKALLDAVLETRFVTILQEVVSELDLKSLGIDPEHPETLFDSIRNPESPLVKSLMDAVHKGLEERIKSGKVRQEDLQRDIERIRAMLQSTFGKFLNEQMFGEQKDGPRVDPRTFLGNSTEARRQRMLARLQKKQRDKMSGGLNK